MTEWSLEDLKKSILDNAEEYDRIMKTNNEENDTSTTTPRVESDKETEAEKPSEE
tara:strand:+ start:710 stop:874 length:165 start_codon:yes stop_codon:yes gene_type:complete